MHGQGIEKVQTHLKWILKIFLHGAIDNFTINIYVEIFGATLK